VKVKQVGAAVLFDKDELVGGASQAKAAKPHDRFVLEPLVYLTRRAVRVDQAKGVLVVQKDPLSALPQALESLVAARALHQARARFFTALFGGGDIT
jgi:hypothetical protein